MLARFRSVVWLLAWALAAGVHAAGETTGLMDAARRGDASTVRALIGMRANVNAAEPDGTTALHWAVRAGDRPTVELLLRAGAKANAATRYGVTPLWLAATNGDEALVVALLKAGADVHVRGPAGETILMAAARTGRLAPVNALLERGADVNATEAGQQQNALMWAAAENHADVVRALVARGANMNAASKVLTPPEWKWATTGMVSTPLPRGGWTPLMYAARQGALEAAAVLAGAGANLDLRDPDGTTALAFAILNVHYDLAGMLIEKGAGPNVTDDTGTSPLYAAVDMHTMPPDLVRPSPVLTDRLDAVDVVRTLLARGADPNVRLTRMPLGRVHQSADPSFGEGSTPLMRAAKSNDLTVMRLLLDKGADPTLTQKDHTNALMIEAAGGARPSVYPADRPVTEVGALDGIALLLDRGVDVDAFNGSGQTALHLAAARGADRIVNLLASRGARLDGRNKQGHTPLEVALGSGRYRPGERPPAVYEKTAALLRQLMGSAVTPGGGIPAAATVAPTASVQKASPIWAGAFSADQVARGKTAYERNCSRCHRDDLSGDEGITLNGERYQTLGPALKGETFYKNWGHGSVNRLFRKVRDAMPPDFQSIIDDATKADVVAFVLHENGFPTGPADLSRDAEVLEGIPIVRQQADVVPNFALVQVTGCLQPGTANRWKLTLSGEPILAREGPLAAADVDAARSGPPGTGEFLLLNTSSFDVNAHRARRAVAKGLLYREPGQNRLTLTALQTTGAPCQN